MKALLWKDLRVNMPVLLAGFIFMAIAFVLSTVVMVYEHWPAWPSRSWWGNGLQHEGLWSLVLTQFITAALGANAFASERTDRSAEFLFYLPATRKMIVVSKLSIALAVVLLFWALHLVIIESGVQLAGHRDESIPEAYYTFAATGALLFGGSWLGSSFLGTPTKALGVGVGLFAIVLSGWVGLFLRTRSADRNEIPISLYLAACLILGIISFAIGTAYFLRRIEP